MTGTSNGLINNTSAPFTGGGGGGSGTVTQINTGNGLTGGPITTSGTISLQPTVVPVTASTKTFALTDANTIQDCNSATAQTLTIPTDASVAFVSGTVIQIEQNGAGNVTIIGATGVTVNGVSAGSFATTTQYSAIYIRKETTNVWYVEAGASGGSGTVTTTGTPASGNLVAFSGSTSITNSNLSGDVATSGTLATTIQANAVTTTKINANAVTYAKMQQESATTLLGNATGSAANVAEVTLGSTLAFSSGALTTAALTGDVTTSAGSFATTIAANAVTTTKINANAVTYAKLQQETARTLLGNPTAGAANVSEITLGSGLAFSGTTLTASGSGGTVTSVTFTGDGTVLSSTPSTAVTTSGTVAATLNTQLANTVFAGPTSGSAASPTFRILVPSDTPAIMLTYFGDGLDGNVTLSSGTTTLTRDMTYQNLTISGTGAINTAGCRIFVSATLDISAAANKSMFYNGNVGGNGGATGTAGAAGSTGTSIYIGSSVAGLIGGVGATGNGASGTANAFANFYGGASGASGAGGAGGTGTAGASAASNAGSPSFYRRLGFDFLKNNASVPGSVPGPGGGGGGGDGTNSGGGGGGGGSGQSILGVWANIIARGSNSASGIFWVKGFAGGIGGTPTTGNAGGGGGGSGSGGGYAYIVYGSLTGSVITNAIDISGGNGGNGGNGVGTGQGGNGGSSGASGAAYIANLTAGTASFTAPGAATTGGAHSGTTGGTGPTATSAFVSL